MIYLTKDKIDKINLEILKIMYVEITGTFYQTKRNITTTTKCYSISTTRCQSLRHLRIIYSILDFLKIILSFNIVVILHILDDGMICFTMDKIDRMPTGRFLQRLNWYN